MKTPMLIITVVNIAHDHGRQRDQHSVPWRPGLRQHSPFLRFANHVAVRQRSNHGAVIKQLVHRASDRHEHPCTYTQSVTNAPEILNHKA